jgi:hypothetical protein
VAILLAWGANDRVRDYIKLTAREQAKGDAVDVFVLYEKKVVQDSLGPLSFLLF